MQNIKIISAKLYALLTFLHRATEQFEIAAGKIKDKNLRMSIREVALETNQYKSELDSQLTALKIKDAENNTELNAENERGLINNNLTADTKTDKEIMTECCKIEIYFEKAYRNVLNEYFPDNSLRTMLVYQLNGIKCAFMQLKLLRSVSRV